MFSLRQTLLGVVLLLAATLSAYAAPCHRAERRVVCEGVSRITHLSSSGMNLWLDIDNQTYRRLVLARGEIDILIEGKLLASISLRDRVVIRRHSRAEVLIPLRFRSYGNVVVWQLLRRLFRGDAQDIAITYRIRGGTWLVRRNFSEENVAISEFFDTFAITKELIGELYAELK